MEAKLEAFENTVREALEARNAPGQEISATEAQEQALLDGNQSGALRQKMLAEEAPLRDSLSAQLPTPTDSERVKPLATATEVAQKVTLNTAKAVPHLPKP